MLNARTSCRPKVSFVDPCCARGYSTADLRSGGLGGTEATILRVATALRDQFDIGICQKGRSDRRVSEAGILLPLIDGYRTHDAAAIVVVNRWKVALKIRKAHRNTPLFLWLHTYPGRHNRKMGKALKEAAITVICVSQTHAKVLRSFLGPSNSPKIEAIYNPIANDLYPDETRRDLDRLLFASSPHKGLTEVFTQFSALREKIPELSLAVADPGYLRWETGPVPDGVTFLGSLSHAELIQQMRKSLCLFYPQTSFAETFGLVLAEANAVGTPVLVHADLGANDEIVSDKDQKIDGDDLAQIQSRIEMWRRSFPRVNANPDFRISNVARRWTSVLLDAVTRQTSLLAKVD